MFEGTIVVLLVWVNLQIWAIRRGLDTTWRADHDQRVEMLKRLDELAGKADPDDDRSYHDRLEDKIWSGLGR